MQAPALSPLQREAAIPPDTLLLRPTPDHEFDWHYHGIPVRQKVPVLAILIAAAAHLFLAYGLNDKPEEAPPPDTSNEVELILMEMPPLEDLEDLGEVEEISEEVAVEASSYVPMQADLPSIVLDSSFVQKLDYSSFAPKPDLNGAQIVAIPSGTLRGGVSVAKDMKDLFDLADLDRRPRPIVQTPPVFPATLKKTDPDGEVVLEFIVTSEGNVVAVSVVSSTNQGFESAAIHGVLHWKFSPGMKAGRKVNTRVRVPIKFHVVEDD